MDQINWAKNEIEILKKKQNGDKYGEMCCDSALKAFLSMADDGHSGFSWSITSNLLTRLLGDLPLTPIQDEDFFDQEGMMQESKDFLKEKALKSSLQCKRMFSLFRQETLDGKVSYIDVERTIAFDLDEYKEKGHVVPFSYNKASRLVDEMFPITMPYYPPKEKYVVAMRGDKPVWIKTPDGEKITL